VTARVFELPDLGEGLTEAELVKWLVAVGDDVRIDQPIAEVETAKSVVEVPSPFAGVVVTLHGEEGEALAVGAPLIEVREAAAPELESKSESESESVSTSSDAMVSSGSGSVLVGYGTSESVSTGRRRRSLSGLRAGAPAPDAPTTEAPATEPQTTEAQPARPHVIPVVSPVVRSLARTHGVDLSTIVPTGADGAVTRKDVEAAFAVPRSASTSATGHGLGSDSDVVDRRTVAANMTRSRAEIPEATVWVDVDATDLWDARRRIRLGDRHPSLLAFIARFTLAALTRYPALAGRVADDGVSLDLFDGVNLGFAVDSPRGLVVPVVRRADRMSIRELDGELERLTRGAREGTLAPAELTGSTFTINNYGSLGVDGSAAIINHPEVAILGIGRMIERPWVVDGAIVPRRIAQLSLVFDHRVTDGGVAAGMLRQVADAVESPLALLADAPPA